MRYHKTPVRLKGWKGEDLGEVEVYVVSPDHVLRKVTTPEGGYVLHLMASGLPIKWVQNQAHGALLAEKCGELHPDLFKPGSLVPWGRSFYEEIEKPFEKEMGYC